MWRNEIAEISCFNCRFWDHCYKEKGECRRKPPTIITKLADREDFQDGTGFWPLTLANGWCGEFQKGNPPRSAAQGPEESIEERLAELERDGSENEAAEK